MFSENKWLGNHRLFIGLEFSHSGPVQTSRSLPSVVGMAYNYNESHSLAGHYFYREQNKAIIADLAAELETPILDYKKRSRARSWPSHIFIYRAGVSEGEYTQG